MRMTDSDKKLFEALGNTETGKLLADYFDRLVDEVYDSRTWKEGFSKETADVMAKLITENLTDKIRLRTEPKFTQSDPYGA